MICGLVLALACWQSPAMAQPAESAQDAPARAEIAYNVTFEGVEGDLESTLRGVSVLVGQRDSRPRSYGALRSRIDEDLKMFRRMLRSRGYYNAQITQRIETGERPIEVVIRVFTGSLYRIAEVAFDFRGKAPESDVIEALRESMGLTQGDPARAAAIVNAEDRIMAALPRHGHPLAVKGERRVVVEHDSDQLRVTYRIAAGPKVRFGVVRFEGGEGVERGHLRRLLSWSEGEVYDRRKVERYRQDLVSTRLFSSVRIGFDRPEDELRAESGPIAPDIVIDLATAPLRTISVGAGYSTSEGIGGEVSWEHRNLFGAQERLRLTGTAAEIEQSLTAEFRKPHFRRRDQTLTAATGFLREDTDAFDSLEYNASLGLERQLSDEWTLSAATEFVATEVDDRDGKRTFLLASLAAGIGYDSRNDILNPTRGLYARFSTTPHLAEQNDIFTFITNELEASSYQKLDSGGRVVLAERVKLGSIAAESRDQLPASRRFFSGGGGSNRGFGFQDVGPLDDMNDPIGGRSLFEASFETRVRVGENFGLVPFVDASRVWEDELPQFSDLQWGAGLGLRYFTDFAPIRVDVAFPINKRPIDNSFQIFISLGQSF